jgi:hypothetical protein
MLFPFFFGGLRHSSYSRRNIAARHEERRTLAGCTALDFSIFFARTRLKESFILPSQQIQRHFCGDRLFGHGFCGFDKKQLRKKDPKTSAKYTRRLIAFDQNANMRYTHQLLRLAFRKLNFACKHFLLVFGRSFLLILSLL